MSYVQARQRSPPPARLITAQATPAQEMPPPLWEGLLAENRRRLSQIVARGIARHRLAPKKEVPDD